MFDTAPPKAAELCSLGKWMTALGDKDRDNLQIWLNSNLPHAELVRAIASEAGKVFDKATVSGHRNGRCRCSTQ